MGIFNTYVLLPQSYKTLPSNVTFCMYWVCETQNLKIFTVSITDYLQNAYVYQLSGMKTAQPNFLLASSEGNLFMFLGAKE